MDRTTYSLTEEELIFRVLKWLSVNKRYRDNTFGGKSSRAVIYNRTWVQLIRRIKDYTADNQNLVDLYDKFKVDWKKDNGYQYDKKILEIFLKYFENEGYKRRMPYLMPQEGGQKFINEIFRASE